MNMKKATKGADAYLLSLIAACCAFIAYWVGYANYKYTAFISSFWDIGQETYSMYIHLHSPALVGGLQFLSFSNHISPFKILELPIFAAYQSPMTLIFIQALLLALAAIVIYLIGKDVAGNRVLGLVLAIAFLVNPGVRGLTFYDVHAEAAIPLFLLLSFYFYMRGKRWLFVASYSVMMSTMEAAPVAGISLILGLLFYEYFYASRKKGAEISSHRQRIKMLLAAFVITLAFVAFYLYVMSALAASYASGGYALMPPFLKLVNFLSVQTAAIGNIAAVQYSPPQLAFVFMLGFVTLFLGFGITSLRNIVLSALLVLPWLIELLVFHNVVFGTLNNQYYAFVVGGAVVAAFLGYMILKTEKKKAILGIKMEQILPFTLSLALMISLILLAFGLGNPIYFLPTNWQQSSNYSSISSALGSIPANASVMAQPSVSAHLYNVLYLELPPNYLVNAYTPSGFSPINITTYYNSRPQYVVLDRQIGDFAAMNNSQFSVYNFMAGNYTPYVAQGGVEIYKLARN